MVKDFAKKQRKEITLKQISAYAFILASALLCGCNTDAARESTEKLRIEGSKPIEVSADSAESPIEGQFKNDLAGTSWTPKFLLEENGAAKPEGDALYMRFTPEMRIEGMAGNNNFFGGVIISENGSFRVSGIATTRKDGPYADYEYKFLQALNKATRISVSSSGKVLKLYNGRRLLMTFRKI